MKCPIKGNDTTIMFIRNLMIIQDFDLSTANSPPRVVAKESLGTV